MNKTLTAYYSFLALAVLAQALVTVLSLSQNIGYGQKISLLQSKKVALETQKNQLEQTLAQKVAISELKQKENQGYIAITDVLTINRNSSSLALK